MSKKSSESTLSIPLFVGLHLLCCGVPLLLLSGVSLAFLVPDWPVVGGVVAVIGLIGFIWYLKRGCATCPRNEGRCAHGEACMPARTGQRERQIAPSGLASLSVAGNFMMRMTRSCFFWQGRCFLAGTMSEPWGVLQLHIQCKEDI